MYSERQAAAPASYLYCMATRCKDGLYFKLGLSYCPAARRQQIETGRGARMPPAWQGEAVELVATRPGGASDERSIHHALAEYRVYRTEWFLGVWAVADYILEQNGWTAWPVEADAYLGV